MVLFLLSSFFTNTPLHKHPIYSLQQSPSVFFFLVRLLAILLSLDIRVLNGQAPNVKVVANGDDDVDDEAAVDADGHTEKAEHEGDLVDAIAEG